MSRVMTGLDVLAEERFRRLRGARVGVLCHQASVDRRLRHLLDLLRDAKIRVNAVFAPEHGLEGTAQDQVPIEDGDPPGQTRQVSPRIFSLYGETRAPTPNHVSNLDVVVCDLQDVGSRYYTFVWTMALAMQACAKAGIRFVVLDRPNPINGQAMEGPVLDLAFASFVGLYSVPVRHGLTIGEMARWINGTYRVGADLEVVPMRGWARHLYFDETGLPWVAPSPNMPTLETALAYPGGCLLEATNVSEGRGTTRPFEWLGAPWVDGAALARQLNRARLPGVYFRAAGFEPSFHKFKGQRIGGVQVHVTARRAFRPFLSYLVLINAIREQYPDAFAWRPPPYEYERTLQPFDILCGTSAVRQAIDSGASLRALAERWREPLARFRRERQPFLLYN